MHNDVVLPAFELDCRDWFVVTPDTAGDDGEDGPPILAELSTAVIGPRELHSVHAVIMIGLVDDVETVPLLAPDGADGVASELIESHEVCDGMVRYLLPAPDGGGVALVAEFSVTGGPDLEASRRIEALMASFRWAA